MRWLPTRSTPAALAVSHTGSALLVFTPHDPTDGAVLSTYSINGRPLRRATLDGPVGRVVCTRDGEIAVASQGSAVTVRRLHDLKLLHRYDVGGEAASGAAEVCALSLCGESHHAFVATEDGGLRIFANPIVNIQVLEQIAGELLNL